MANADAIRLGAKSPSAPLSPPPASMQPRRHQAQLPQSQAHSSLSESPLGLSPESGSVAGSVSSSSIGQTNWCAVCQDTASGIHYGVPACEGCKGFFRRIVSSSTPAGACSHANPLVITPQTRNACQWCRLKKCCAVNMGRQRSKLGRRARAQAVDSGISVANGQQEPETPSQLDAEAAHVTDQQLLLYIELKRREFECQVRRRTCFKRQVSACTKSAPSSGRRTKQSRQVSGPSSHLVESPLASASSTPIGSQSNQPLSPISGRSERPLLSRQASSSRSPPTPQPAPLPQLPSNCPTDRSWLAGFRLDLPADQWLNSLCQRLTNNSDASSLLSRCQRPGIAGSSARLVLRSVDKFFTYWEADLNDRFADNPRCGRAIAESTELILEGHRRTAYFCQDRMARFRSERLAKLREPSPAEESIVVNRLVAGIPQLMLRIVAFARNIFGASAQSSTVEAQQQQQQQQQLSPTQDRVLASRCSDVLLDTDKRRLIVHHCFKVIAMRFCDALVRHREGYIIDPTLQYRLTRKFLLAANHPMLSQLFIKFFDVSVAWDSLGIAEHELAFLSAICLTSPILDPSNSEATIESQFEDANAVLSVHSAVIGLFWIHLRSVEMTRRGCNALAVKANSRLNLELRMCALNRILELSGIFENLLSIDGLHKKNASMIESIIERLSSGPSTASSSQSHQQQQQQPVLTDGFPDFSAAFNPVGRPTEDPELLNQYGAGIYEEVFRRRGRSSGHT